MPSGADLQRGRDRDQREGVARPVAHLAIGRARREGQRRQLDRRDQLAGPELGLDDRAGRPAAGADRSAAARASPSGPSQVDDRVERRERHAHVRRVRRDAGGRGAEDGVVAVEALQRVAALRRARACCSARRRRRSRCSACAAGGCRRRVAMLRICAEAPARMARASIGIAGAHRAVAGDGRVLDAGADHQAAVGAFLDAWSDSPLTSTSAAGRSIVSRIRSTRLVPPPRYLAPGADQPERGRRVASRARS